MNKEQIKSKMQSIEESIKEQTNELNKLRLEMDKPEKPTLEEMCKVMYRPFASGEINKDSGYAKDGYLSRERAEKEKLRIKLTVIADHFNGGLFEQTPNETGFAIYVYLPEKRVQVGENSSCAYGKILFKTREHAELAMTYFTNDELIKMLK